MINMFTVLGDVRFALRTVRKNLAFTIVATVTLALGIGATTAIFTLVEQVMLRPLPVVQPDRLWRVGDAVRCCYATGFAQNDWSFFPWEAYKLFRDNTPAFEELAAFQVGNAALAVRPEGGTGPVAMVNGEYVSGSFFKTFGIAPLRGRFLTDADDVKGAPPVAVMSFHTWQGKFGSDPSVIGSTYQINGHPFTMIGVAPPGFYGAKLADSSMPDVWLPLTTEPVIEGTTSRLENPRTAWLDIIGRVRPDTNPTTLEAQLQVELQQWLASHVADMPAQERATREKQTLHLTPGGAGVSLMRASYADGLRLLMLATGCVLLVACANLANLLLARGLKTRDQTALRAALGASRARLVRMALAESLTLAVFGGVAGIVVAYAGSSLIVRLALERMGSVTPVSATPSAAVLLFALSLSIVTGVVFGIAPAWIVSKADPIEALRGANRAAGGHRHWALKTLVIVQAAVSLVLLSAAAMLGQSLHNLEHQDFGFDASGRYVVWINTKLSNYRQEQMDPILRDIEDRVRRVPGVRSVSTALYSPLSGYGWWHEIRIAGKPETGPADERSSGWTRVRPGFFETLDDRIVMGRPITDDDTRETRPVAVVNEAFAKKFFGQESPIGQHFGPASRGKPGMYEIVGVASDMRYFMDVSRPIGPMYFVPQAQTIHFDDANLDTREVWSHFPYTIVIWAPGKPPDLGAQVTRVLADFAIPFSGMQPYAEVIHTDFAQQNMIASLTWVFGALALVLAAVGLYGVTAYGVEQRTREIGIRLALGAHCGSVMTMVLRGALWQVGIGLALGIPSAIAAGHAIASQLFNVTPWDPLLLSAATVLLALAASIAGIIPARRATRVDPMIALRHD
jgi:putative ABC transport system permease protein